jgi:hypothetical protein
LLKYLVLHIYVSVAKRDTLRQISFLGVFGDIFYA